MALYKFILPTPTEHPGFVEMLFHHPDTRDWTNEYTVPAPPRGPAWDKSQRGEYAKWKQGLWVFILQQPGVSILQPIVV